MTENYFLSENNIPYREFFHFGLSVDCVIFGYQNGQLKLLLIKRGADPFKGRLALPGDLVSIDEALDDSATRILKHLTGIDNIFLEQFQTFGSVVRHPAGRVVSVGYFSLVKSENYLPIASGWAETVDWVNISEAQELAFDHDEILAEAIKTLKRKVQTEPVGFELLPEKFTLAELQNLYEQILGSKFDKPNFRKKIMGINLLTPLEEIQENVAHRPAKLYSFNKEEYSRLKKKGLGSIFQNIE
jgi:8-oxo-dGTP diphosphatase